MTAIDHTEESGKKTEIIAFSSGKGGTGKTLIATCLGYALTKIGLRVLMIDSDTATDGLSLYLLGPAGLDKVKDFPLGSTLTGILRQYKEQGNFQFQPWKINRSLKEDHGVIYEAIISGRQLYGDRFDTSRDDSSTQLDRESYRKVIQTMFDSLRAKAEFDYVIVDTRGGFSGESTDVSALADSYIVVTEADVTSFYQNRNLIQYIDQAASDFGKKAILRSIIVNKSTQFTSTTSDFDLDNLESSFRLQLEREFPIDYKATHPFPLSFEALTVQKSHKIPIRHALDSDFSYAFLVAFHNILSVVTQPWTKEQVEGWNYLVESVNLAIQKKSEDLQKAELEEQEQHKELEKLRKDNLEYVSRISSLEREIREIDERYKREIQRSEIIASKLESEKKAVQPEPGSKKVTKPPRNWTPGIIGIFIVGLVIVSGIIFPGFLPFGSSSPTATLTTSALAPTGTSLSSATEPATIQAIEVTQTASPTETPAPATAITSTAVDCSPIDAKKGLPGNVAHFISETIPPETILAPGQLFDKTWILRNVGSKTWTTDYTINYATGEGMGATQPNTFPSIASPGECIEITLVMRAPNSSGTYEGHWVLQDAKQERFNFDDPKMGTLDVIIIVPSPTTSPTP
jgi:MinD-like ATPase involved in chromosome partitioning or flagellar assembly